MVVTAYGDYAVQAFETGALDYLLKPVEPERLAETAARIRERIESSRPAVNDEALLRELTARMAELRTAAAPERLQWIRALAARLDPSRSVQVHRSAVVSLRAIRHVRRLDNETAVIHLKGRTETLPVSRSYVHLFRQM